MFAFFFFKSLWGQTDWRCTHWKEDWCGWNTCYVIHLRIQKSGNHSISSNFGSSWCGQCLKNVQLIVLKPLDTSYCQRQYSQNLSLYGRKIRLFDSFFPKSVIRKMSTNQVYFKQMFEMCSPTSSFYFNLRTLFMKSSRWKFSFFSVYLRWHPRPSLCIHPCRDSSHPAW